VEDVPLPHATSATSLAYRRKRQVARTLILDRAAIEVLRTFATADVPALLLKGASFAPGSTAMKDARRLTSTFSCRRSNGRKRSGRLRVWDSCPIVTARQAVTGTGMRIASG
jgi:hypothetical protein